MALVTANGLTVYDFQLRRPRVGAWHADMRVESSVPIVGAVTLVIDDGFRTFVGTAARSREFAESAQLRVVAGANGLGLSARPKHYNSTNLGIVLADLLRDAGERLSGTVDSRLLATAIDSWSTTALPVGALITALVHAIAPTSAWRTLPDGTFWIGAETWPGAGLDASTYEVMDEAAEDGSMLVQVDRPSIDPGTTFEGRRVSYVQDDVPHTEPVQTRVWFEDALPSEVGRMRQAFAALVQATPAAVDRRMHAADVVAQPDGSNIVDVAPENTRVPDMGAVPVFLGLPHTRARVRVPTGQTAGRALVGWQGSPPRAYVAGFDAATRLEELVIAEGSEGVARKGDTTKLTLSTTDVAALAAALLTTGAFTPSGNPPGPSSTPVPLTGGEITGGSSIVKVGG